MLLRQRIIIFIYFNALLSYKEVREEISDVKQSSAFGGNSGSFTKNSPDFISSRVRFSGEK